MINAREDEQQWSNSGGRMAGGEEQSEETIGGKPLTLQSRQEG